MMYAHERGEKDVTSHVGFFNGIFGMFMLLTGVSGNMISSVFFFFAAEAGDDDCSVAQNSTAAAAETNAVPQSVVTGLFSIYLLSVACGVACATVMLPGPAVMVAEREEHGLNVEGDTKKPSLMTTIRMLRQPRMYLLGPICECS